MRKAVTISVTFELVLEMDEQDLSRCAASTVTLEDLLRRAKVTPYDVIPECIQTLDVADLDSEAK